jgi:hypothetical protein
VLESHDGQNDVEHARLRILIQANVAEKTAKRLPAKGESIAAFRMPTA